LLATKSEVVENEGARSRSPRRERKIESESREGESGEADRFEQGSL